MNINSDKLLNILNQYDYNNIRIYIVNNYKISDNNNYYDLSNDTSYINMIIDMINNKLKNIKNIQYTLKREHYYSQIRDIDIKRKREKCYVVEEKMLNKLKINNIQFIINSYDIYTQDLESFPNLHKYHYDTNIEKIEFIFDNIKLVIENNNIFIDLKKKFDVKELNKILDLLN